MTLISDLPGSPRAGYVGLDNRAAGRTAGLLMGRFLGSRKGKVAMIAGSLSCRGHEEREMGFLHVMRESFPQLKIVGVREGRDDATTNHRLARGLLEQHPDLIGLYNIGDASDGVGRALKESGREPMTGVDPVAINVVLCENLPWQVRGGPVRAISGPTLTVAIRIAVVRRR